MEIGREYQREERIRGKKKRSAGPRSEYQREEKILREDGEKRN